VDVDGSAPAVASGSIEIEAAPEVVWDVLTTIGDWPSWNPDVRTAALDGDLAPGTTFRWKAGPGTITSTIQELDPPHRITWTGRTVGIKAIHVYRLEAGATGTSVVSEESWAGLPVRLLRGFLRKQLQRSTDTGLQHLKREAERRSAGSPIRE
jgi:hypothetical protein